ncbi:MAG: hypothetical protein ACJ710_02400 [Ornithinibacter sp.]
MSLIRTVTAGALVGSVAALGIFVSLGPDDMGRAAAPAAPTYGPVPTPTVTRLADCTPPAKLKKGVCVTTKVVVRSAAVASTGTPTSSPRSTPRTAPTPTPSPTVSDPAAVDPRATPTERSRDHEEDD